MARWPRTPNPPLAPHHHTRTGGPASSPPPTACARARATAPPQRSDPFRKRSRGVDGYEPVACAQGALDWGGLQHDGKKALLNGSSSKACNSAAAWFYAFGSFKVDSVRS
jgi:hypothetical protein